MVECVGVGSSLEKELAVCGDVLLCIHDGRLQRTRDHLRILSENVTATFSTPTHGKRHPLLAQVAVVDVTLVGDQHADDVSLAVDLDGVIQRVFSVLVTETRFYIKFVQTYMYIIVHVYRESNYAKKIA